MSSISYIGKIKLHKLTMLIFPILMHHQSQIWWILAMYIRFCVLPNDKNMIQTCIIRLYIHIKSAAKHITLIFLYSRPMWSKICVLRVFVTIEGIFWQNNHMLILTDSLYVLNGKSTNLNPHNRFGNLNTWIPEVTFQK